MELLFELGDVGGRGFVVGRGEGRRMALGVGWVLARGFGGEVGFFNGASLVAEFYPWFARC